MVDTAVPSSSSPKPQCTIIKAPRRPPIDPRSTTVFLAGNTSGPSANWRGDLIPKLEASPALPTNVTILDPARADWDPETWREDPSFAPWREQVQWELDMAERADLLVVHFGGGALAPVSLLELGVRLGSGRACVVCCEEGYEKRGNVLVVCERFGVGVCRGLEELAKGVGEAVEKLVIAGKEHGGGS